MSQYLEEISAAIEERRYDDADMRYDEMRDDFLMIDSEESAKRCIDRYPSVAKIYTPIKYRYLLEVENE